MLRISSALLLAVSCASGALVARPRVGPVVAIATAPATLPLLEACADSGPVGVDASVEQQDAIEGLAVELTGTGADAAAKVPLSGTYELLYSMAKGGSNGKVGPFTGSVTQIILDEKNFINQVELFGGALTVQLYAEREVLGDDKIRVSFVETVFKLFGNEVKRQPTQGKGVWEQLYVEAGADGTAALRVMRTPSLFILRQRSK